MARRSDTHRRSLLFLRGQILSGEFKDLVKDLKRPDDEFKVEFSEKFNSLVDSINAWGDEVAALFAGQEEEAA